MSDTRRHTILVTGASSGIGRAIALRLAEDGFDIVINYRDNTPGAEDTAARILALGASARLLQFDVCERDLAARKISDDISRYGAYYGVVLNAGVTRDGAFPLLGAQDWDLVVKTSLDGFYNVLQPAIMPMIQRRAPGRIVSIASVSGIRGNRGQTNYSAAKAGLIGASKALGLELARRGITVNCVAPGLIDTAMTSSVPENIKELIPMRRSGSPEEVAAVVGFLMSAGASYVNRQVIAVDGGLS